MTMTKWTAALLAATALSGLVATAATAATKARSTSAASSTSSLAATVAAQQAKIDELTRRLNEMSAAPAPAAVVAPNEEAEAANAFLAAQVDALQAQLDTVKKQTALNTATFKAAPEFVGDNGWKFKVRGRFMYDLAYTDNPGDTILTKDLGLSTRIRRFRIGVEGAMPGGFGYKAEVDYANAAIGFGDVILTYRGNHGGKLSPFEFTIGNFESLDGLEQVTSSRFISFVERAQFNEAFNNTRRLGVAATYISADSNFRFTVGAFNDTINADRGFNDEYILAARTTYTMQAFGGLLDFGANYQHRRFQTFPTSGTGGNGYVMNYQVRPFTQNTDTRFVSTGGLAAEGDDIFGAEFVGIFGPLHVTAEGQYNKVKAIGTTTPIATCAAVASNFGCTNGARLNGDPSFFGFYAEAGYWLTGETRGFKNGLWDRTKVLNPIDKGGMGAFQINGRFDYLDLQDRVTGVAGSNVLPNYVNGGRQIGYLASLIWQPIDYVRFTFQYTRGDVKGGSRQQTVSGAVRCPANSDAALGCNFGYNVGVVRAAFDF